MKFGKVHDPGQLDLHLPCDADHTARVLKEKGKTRRTTMVYTGFPRWAKTELKDFYPKGTKDELAYYSTQFNAIELNAFYYRIFSPTIVAKWYERSTPGFMFFPKVPQLISQFRRLKNCRNELDDFLLSISHFKEKLGTVFLQMNENYGPEHLDALAHFLQDWPVDVPLSVEVRHRDWFADTKVADQYFDLLETNHIGATITDTAGRRDLVHMRLTTPSCFVRFTGANHSTDIDRIDAWCKRLTEWKIQGIDQINFFIHQTVEKDLPMLSTRLKDTLVNEW